MSLPLGQNPIARQRSAARYCIYLAGFVLFFWYTVLPLIGTDLSRIPGDLGDPRFNLYILEHSYKYFSGQESTFWGAGFYYPHQNVVAYSDNFLGSCIFYVPFRVMGCDRETAYQCFLMTGFLLNFAGMAFVLDRRGFGRLPVILGASVFTFSPVQILHLGHIQVLHRMPVPLAWHFLDRFLEDYRPSSLGLALAFLCWQFYMSLYMGYFLFLVMFFYVIAVVLERKRSVLAQYLDATSRRTRLYHAGLALGFAVSFFALYVHYSVPGISRNTIAVVLQLLPRPLSYLAGSRNGLIEKTLGAQFVFYSAAPWEHTLFVGLVPWAALVGGTVLAIRGRVSSSSRIWRLSFVFWGIFLMTLSVHGISVYRILVKLLPLLTGIRTVSREVHVLLLPLAYMTAAGMEHLSGKRPGWLPGKLAGVAALAICLVFAWETKVGPETVNKAEFQWRVTTMEESLGKEQRRPNVSEDGPVLVAMWLDKSEKAIHTQLDAMLAAQDLNIVTLNGYSRLEPPGFQYPTDCSTLAEVLRDYARIFPEFSIRDVASRIRIAPGSFSCGNPDTPSPPPALPVPNR